MDGRRGSTLPDRDGGKASRDIDPTSFASSSRTSSRRGTNNSQGSGQSVAHYQSAAAVTVFGQAVSGVVR